MARWVSLKARSASNSHQTKNRFSYTVPPCAVPQSIMPQLKKELDKMEHKGIIRTCPETTEWVHNLVTVVKKEWNVTSVPRS